MEFHPKGWKGRQKGKFSTRLKPLQAQLGWRHTPGFWSQQRKLMLWRTETLPITSIAFGHELLSFVMRQQPTLQWCVSRQHPRVRFETTLPLVKAANWHTQTTLQGMASCQKQPPAVLSSSATLGNGNGLGLLWISNIPSRRCWCLSRYEKVSCCKCNCQACFPLHLCERLKTYCLQACFLHLKNNWQSYCVVMICS